MPIELRKGEKHTSNTLKNTRTLNQPQTGEEQVRGIKSSSEFNGVTHCCCSLKPEVFFGLTSRSNNRVPFQLWYKALYLVVHNKNISTTALRAEINVSWPTAQTMRKKILATIQQCHKAKGNDVYPSPSQSKPHPRGV